MKYKLKTMNYNEHHNELILNDLLMDRGIKNPEEWLMVNDKYENSPWLFNDMIHAISLLKTVMANRDAKVCVVVDSDVDGFTSASIILSLLKEITWGEQEIQYVIHPGKEHGIILDELPDDFDLLIVPDAGTNDVDAHITLLKSDKKVIILDHHEIDKVMDYEEYSNNISIINSMEEQFPNHSLSGAGVALKFVQAYCEKYGKQFINKLYGLAACGIVADVMDMSVLENKYIVEQGLKYIKEHQFLYKLIKDARYNDENPTPTIKDIGWIISPNINSIIRLGTQDQKKVLLRALISPLLIVPSTKRGESDEEVPIFEEAIRFCKNTKNRQTNIVEKNIDIIKSKIQLKENDKAIVYVDEDQELTFELSGLIANKLLSDYNLPIILLRNYKEQNGNPEYRGSVRSKCVEGLDNFKDFILGITGVIEAAGHGEAFGLHLDKSLFSEFKVHLQEALQKVDFNANLYLIDFIANYRDVNLENAKIMSRDDIWCHGVEKPIGLITDISTNRFEVMGNNNQHLKIDCGKFDLIAFNVPSLTNDLVNGEKFNLDAIGEFSVDKSYNVGRLQFIVKDWEKKQYKEKDIYDWVF